MLSIRKEAKEMPNIYFIRRSEKELQTDTLFISCRAWNVLYLSGMLHTTLYFFWIIVGKPSYSVVLAALANRRMPACGAAYSGTQVLNGDRALLCPLPNGDYEITGWPVCGSSGICHNERRPLEAIVFIEQASDNTIRPQTAMKHFKALCSQVTINWWNPKLTRQSTRRSQVWPDRQASAPYRATWIGSGLAGLTWKLDNEIRPASKTVDARRIYPCCITLIEGRKQVSMIISGSHGSIPDPKRPHLPEKPLGELRKGDMVFYQQKQRWICHAPYL